MALTSLCIHRSEKFFKKVLTHRYSGATICSTEANSHKESEVNDMVSMTRQLRSKITNPDIRKNVTKITYYYDEDFEVNMLEIFFKPDSVRSLYSDDYMESCTASIHGDMVYSMNEWLKEIAYV